MTSKSFILFELLLLVSLVAFHGCNRSSMKSLLPRGSESSRLLEHAPLSIWHDSYESAIEESQKTGKPILADFTGSDWCHWCVKLKTDVFETETFQNWAQDNVVLLELDFPKRGMQAPRIKQQNQELANRFQIKSYPTVLFLDSHGGKIGTLGYLKDPEDWIAQAEIQLSGGAE